MATHAQDTSSFRGPWKLPDHETTGLRDHGTGEEPGQAKQKVAADVRRLRLSLLFPKRFEPRYLGCYLKRSS